MSTARSLRLLNVTIRSALPVSSARFAHARNTFINFVPQQEAWVVERMGKFYKILEPVCSCFQPLLS
ncbi:hypothetical protein ANCCAN_09469 [Ancylostoma caninum]|uniref:Uncharacterized protein n=1 Tax=Ancylostoma caninum TaxID=29170 RepID=A0A368GJL5_ANCCA|nr:hypothetical protein ANCCAN_09469 [Ancylostoma caninum]